MTHTLHRRGDLIPEPLTGRDYVILSMGCQGFNDKGAGRKLSEIFVLAGNAGPDNLADDNFGGRLTGKTDEEILDHMGDKAYIGAAFSDSDTLARALRMIKEADLGMSLVVTGNYDEVFKVLEETGLEAHTVNMSLGVFGKQDLLPADDILAVVAMCGHGMVTRQYTSHIMHQVQEGKLSPEEGGQALASTCTCGIFNPVLAAQALSALRKEPS